MMTLVEILSLLTLLNYVFFLLLIFKGLRKIVKQKAENISPEVKVAVVVPFRNEINNLPNLVESLLNQNYPEELTEIIFVNDNSNDGSVEFLMNNPHKDKFKLLSVNTGGENFAGKKEAITQAIEKTDAEIIFITDADCLHSPEWISETVKYFREDVGFVAGPVIFEEGKGVFNALQRIEFAGIQVAAAGLIGVGFPATCSAANIAFRRTAFVAVEGYKGNLNLSSGDDEFLMQKIHSHSGYKVKFVAGKNIKVVTKANSTVKEFFNQRRRWASKSLFYENKILIAELSAVFLFYLLILFDFLAGFILSAELLALAVLMFVIKIFLEFIVMRKGLKLLYPDEKFKCFFLSELLHIPYILLSAVLGVSGNFEWKGRRVKR